MKRDWNWSASILYIVVLLAWLVAVGIFIYSSVAHAQVPQQAQASNLAVPEPKHVTPPHKAYPYASGVVVTECRAAKAVILFDKHGLPHTQHMQDLGFKELMDLLTSSAPPENIIEVTLACPTDKTV